MGDSNVLYRSQATPVGRQRGLCDDHATGGRHRPQNISSTERLVSNVGGSALLLSGLLRGRFSGLLLSVCGGALLYRGLTGHCSCYEALGVDTSEHPDATAVPARQGVKVEKSVTINRSPEDLYSFWRDVENLPGIMQHLERVEALDANRSRWTAKGPRGASIEWEAEIFNEHEPELIAWRSLPDSKVETAGSIHFKALEHDRGTQVSISMKYNPPAGKLGATIANLLGGALENTIHEDLRRFKSFMEAGEIPRV